MFSLRRVWSAVLAAALVAGTAHVQLADPFAAPAVRVARATANQALSPASADAPAEVVRAYLRTAGHAEATVASLQLAGSSVVQRTGVTHLRFIQRVGGLDVYGVYAKASVRANGELSSVTSAARVCTSTARFTAPSAGG